jgi:hypothetical protein
MSFTQILQGMGAPPGYGTILLPDLLKLEISADDARRFLQYGGFPKTAPAAGSPEFRIEVEAVKARWASCDITNPVDPYRVLTEVVATARTEWDADPQQMPPAAMGAHIALDPTTAGQVHVHWECGDELRSRASAASRAGDFSNSAVRLHVTALFALTEAIVKILKEAGYEAGMGVEMADHYLWVKRPAP